MNAEKEHNVTVLLTERTLTQSRMMLDQIEQGLDIASIQELEQIIKTLEEAFLHLSTLT